MIGLAVSIRPPTKAGRLYPRYVHSAGILAVGSEIERPWPFGLDIDGNLVLDLDDQRVLANFDLHIPMTLWQIASTTDLPPIVRPGDLVFSPEVVAQRSFSLPLHVTKIGQQVLIEFAAVKPASAVPLSETCCALMLGSELVGFVVTLSNDSSPGL